ncbi:hypothetical protein TNCV_3629141 [Trichonephila clavipes]|nr:hypothetical protein TNCV_3629141 [Trichonephila clavipes]
MALTAMPWGLGSNIGEGMDVGKCIVSLRHGGTLNNHLVASPLVRFVEGGGRPLITPRSSPPKLRWNRAKSCCHLHSAQSYS